MKTQFRYAGLFLPFFSAAMLFISPTVFSQAIIKGKVIYNDISAPASMVNIELVNDKSAKTMSDNNGNFKLSITEAQKKDSLAISSVGYKTLKMPVAAALTKNTFRLIEIVKTIEGVTVFKAQDAVGSKSETVGYYRSWTPRTGGEIGRVFKVPYKKFKIDKIRFKATNTCDTCLLRLHIRYVEENGEPGEEMLDDSISTMVNMISLDSKVSEFDLTPFDFTFTENEFFVGVELMNCGNGNKGSCSFNFAGTEKGIYIYKNFGNSTWQSSEDYTIYLKLFLRY